jgi:nucleoside-diphosphate-sugar epimerase
VTGARTGYVGAGVLIKHLLQQEGIPVHPTVVRDPSKNERFQYLQTIADNSPDNGSIIQFLKGDLLKDGSFFAEGMQGCKIVFHTASSFAMSGRDVKDPNKELVEPAVKGTEIVLRTASPSVKRVVLTS